MDLDTVGEIADPRTTPWQRGDAWLGGGSWLFSEPQPDVRRLLDLSSFGWPSLTVESGALRIAATCTLAELAAYRAPSDWLAAPLFAQCAHALLGSFKVHNVATVGGNICLALPAGPMISLAAALDGRCEVARRDRGVELLPVPDVVIGAGRTSILPGDLLRAVLLPLETLRQRTAFRQIALSPVGRSAALIVGRLDPSGVVITVTAATTRPVQVTLAPGAAVDGLLESIDAAAGPYHDDVHGDPRWRRAMTHRLVRQVVAELSA
ncbi:MAG: hypothetical protein QOG80_602 [Pseudonocardiales bacterium]|jgi:CO/xanthine dehydrogenase FAD-binding subunit|nr:hypothetical protein [Pseudonocardiales bacterium]